MTEQRKLRAVVLMLISACSFSVMQIFVKLTSAEIGTFEQVFFRNLVSLVIAYGMVRREHVHPLRELKGQWAVWGRSFFGFLGILLFFYAVANAPQTEVAMMNRSAPVFVTFFAGIFLREKITSVKVLSVLLCLTGAYIAMNPRFAGSPVLPLASALLAAVSSGVAYTMLSYCAGKVNSSTIILHFSAFSTVAAGLLMIPQFVLPTPRTFLMLLCVGGFAALGQFFLTYAYHLAPASEVSIYQYSGVVFTALFSFLVFRETLSARSMLGGVLILAAIFWVFEYHKRKEN